MKYLLTIILFLMGCEKQIQREKDINEILHHSDYHWCNYSNNLDFYLDNGYTKEQLIERLEQCKAFCRTAKYKKGDMLKSNSNTNCKFLVHYPRYIISLLGDLKEEDRRTYIGTENCNGVVDSDSSYLEKDLRK